MVSVKISLDKFSRSPFTIPLPDFYFDAFFFFGRDFRLAKDNFDTSRVIVWDKLRVAELVDKRLAASCKIVGVEETDCASRNAKSSANLALVFSF